MSADWTTCRVVRYEQTRIAKLRRGSRGRLVLMATSWIATLTVALLACWVIAIREQLVGTAFIIGLFAVWATILWSSCEEELENLMRRGEAA